VASIATFLFRSSAVCLVASWVLVGSAVGQEKIGAFSFVRQIDPITDEDESLTWTTELEPTLLRTAELVWRCGGPAGIEVFLSVDEFLDLNGPVNVRWRFDRQPASEVERWGLATNSRAAFLPVQGIPDFTRQARQAASLVVRVSDYRPVEYDLRFSMAGSSAAIGRLPCSDRIVALERQQQQFDSISAAREESFTPPAGATHVGNPATKSFWPVSANCWRDLIVVGSPVFFFSQEEALEQGYRRGPGCGG